MDSINPQKKLIFAAAGGLVGFLVIQVAFAVVFVAALLAGGFAFGGGIHSWQDNLFVAIFVPMLISLGAAIPAWGLGAKWWQGLLAGIIAMVVFIYIESNGGKYVDYSPFSHRETLAYVSTVLVSVLAAIVGMNKFYLKKIVLLTVVAGLVGLGLVVAGGGVIVGLVISLLAWIVFPLAAASS